MKHLFICGLLVIAFAGQSLAQKPGDVRVSISHAGNSDFPVTPVWFGFHDGRFDLGDAGKKASPALENLAEGGDITDLQNRFRKSRGTAAQGVVSAPKGFSSVIEPGEKGEVFFTPSSKFLANAKYLSIATMVIPSNDTFIANLGPKKIDVSSIVELASVRRIPPGLGIFAFVDGSWIYDAGTERNTGRGAAFSKLGGTSTSSNANITRVPFSRNQPLGNLLRTKTAAGKVLRKKILKKDLYLLVEVSLVPGLKK